MTFVPNPKSCNSILRVHRLDWVLCCKIPCSMIVWAHVKCSWITADSRRLHRASSSGIPADFSLLQNRIQIQRRSLDPWLGKLDETCLTQIHSLLPNFPLSTFSSNILCTNNFQRCACQTWSVLTSLLGVRVRNKHSLGWKPSMVYIRNLQWFGILNPKRFGILNPKRYGILNPKPKKMGCGSVL